MSGAMIAYHNS